MKISLALGPRRPLDQPTAWVCVLANQLSLPGVGSLAAGRRAGYGQVTLALIGIGPTLVFSLRLLLALVHFQQASGAFDSFDELLAHAQLRVKELPQNWGLYFWIGVPGLGIFATAWLWALASSVGILRKAYRHKAQARKSTVM